MTYIVYTYAMYVYIYIYTYIYIYIYTYTDVDIRSCPGRARQVPKAGPGLRGEDQGSAGDPFDALMFRSRCVIYTIHV